MKILVTGKNGQLASSIQSFSTGRKGCSLEFAERPGFDLEDAGSIETTIRRVNPDLIINAAAWTAVDDAEDAEDRAFVCNAEAAGTIAREASRLDARLIHVSTDYVFDGSKPAPYVETDPPRPTGAYGRTKLAGERAVLDAAPDAVILRTAWVYSEYGRNFLKTMLALAENRDKLTVVNDQFGNPTSAHDLAQAILKIANELKRGGARAEGGIYHCAGNGEASWAEFAKTIFEASKAVGGPSASVEGIPSSQWPTKAARPANSRLDCSKIAGEFGIEMPHYRDSTNKVVMRLLQSEAA